MGKASVHQTDLEVSAIARGFRTAAACWDAQSETCPSIYPDNLMDVAYTRSCFSHGCRWDWRAAARRSMSWSVWSSHLIRGMQMSIMPSLPTNTEGRFREDTSGSRFRPTKLANSWLNAGYWVKWQW